MAASINMRRLSAVPSAPSWRSLLALPGFAIRPPLDRLV
jgi:hypothetical protein